MSEKEALDVSLMGPEDLGALIRGRDHWIVVFGRTHTEYIDKLDAALAVYPTFPTVIGPLTMTIIPKSKISAQQMTDAMDAAAGVKTPEVGPRDVLVITSDQYEAAMIMAGMAELAGEPEA